jgi:hypothetical protein
MTSASDNREKWFSVRLTTAEFEELKLRAQRSTAESVSEYGRRLLLRKRDVKYTHNQSLDDFIAALGELNPNLDKIRQIMNASLKRLHEIGQVTDIQQWIIQNESDKTRLFKDIHDIKELLSKSYAIWSRK